MSDEDLLSEYELQALLDADERDLLVTIGRALLPASSGFGSDDDEFSRRLAKRWIDDHRGELRNVVCVHPLVVRILSEEDGTLKTTEVAGSIGAAIAVASNMSVAGATAIFVVLVRWGLPRFCGTAASQAAPSPAPDDDPAVRRRRAPRWPRA